MKTTHRLLVVLATCVAVFSTGALSASAAAVPEWDHVEGWTSNSGMVGDVYWRSNRYASGNITVYNDMNDGVCTALRVRLKTALGWTAWSWVGSVCTQRAATFGVYANGGSYNVQYFQLEVYEASTSNRISDTNSPGGA